nr:hypothetical protein [uncultured Roseateles sp.]
MIARLLRQLCTLHLRWTIANLDDQIALLQHHMARDLVVLNTLSLFGDHSAVLALRCAEERQLLARLQERRAKLVARRMQITPWSLA